MRNRSLLLFASTTPFNNVSKNTTFAIWIVESFDALKEDFTKDAELILTFGKAGQYHLVERKPKSETSVFGGSQQKNLVNGQSLNAMGLGQGHRHCEKRKENENR